MNPEPNAQEPTPCEVPIAELLDRIPTDHRLVIEEPMSSTHIPVGVHCRKASATIRRLESENAVLRKERDAHWMLLCRTVEAMGKVSPEAAPYADRWAAALRAEVDRLNEIITGVFPETGALHEILARAGCVSVNKQQYDALRAAIDAAQGKPVAQGKEGV